MEAATKGKGEVADFSIKPEAVAPPIPTSEWPLLLKNYDKRMYPTYGLCGGGRRRECSRSLICAVLNFNSTCANQSLHSNP